MLGIAQRIDQRIARLKSRQVGVGNQHTNALTTLSTLAQFSKHGDTHSLFTAIKEQQWNSRGVVHRELTGSLLSLLLHRCLAIDWRAHRRQNGAQSFQADPARPQDEWH